MDISRRTFVKGSTAAALTAGGAGLVWGLRGEGEDATPQPSPAPLRSQGLRKCLSMGPIDSPEGDDQDLRAHENLADVRASGSRWVKLWLRWDQVQPSAPGVVDWLRLGEPVNPGYPFLRALDEQIALARRQRPAIGVVVTLYRFPGWANGTAGLVEGGAAERAFEPQDRLTRAQGEAGGARRPLAFRIPAIDELGVDGHWGRWVRFLLERYRRHGTGVVLELANEPNLQWWPQQGPSTGTDPFDPGPLEAPRRLARMLDTAERIAIELGSPTPLAGPGIADHPTVDPVPGPGGRTYSAFDAFTTATLDELDRLGFRASPKFVWTQHNYVDTLLDLGRGGAGLNRAAATRRLLRGRWTGWPGGGHDPGLWLTEGGVDLHAARVAGDREKQARLVAANLRRLADRGGDGAGVGMVTQYLDYSEPHFDSGLRDPLAQGGARRPVDEVWRNPSGGAIRKRPSG